MDPETSTATVTNWLLPETSSSEAHSNRCTLCPDNFVADVGEPNSAHAGRCTLCPRNPLIGTVTATTVSIPQCSQASNEENPILHTQQLSSELGIDSKYPVTTAAPSTYSMQMLRIGTGNLSDTFSKPDISIGLAVLALAALGSAIWYRRRYRNTT